MMANCESQVFRIGDIANFYLYDYDYDDYNHEYNYNNNPEKKLYFSFYKNKFNYS